MLHLPLFLDTGGFVLPIPCPVAETVAHNTHTEDSFHSGKECLSHIPSPPVLWLFPTCLPYLPLLQFSGTCLPAFLRACVSHSPQLPDLIPLCCWKTEVGV